LFSVNAPLIQFLKVNFIKPLKSDLWFYQNIINGKKLTMKRFILPAAAILMISTNAFAKPKKHSQVNTAAISASADVSKLSAALAFVPASKVVVAPKEVIDETNDVEDEGYDIIMSGKNFEGDVLYGDDGSLIGYYEQIKDTQMPDAVISAIEAKYPGAKFTKDVERINDNGLYTDVYKAHFIYGNKHGYALIDADGKIIRSRK
jgi:hypothetical protein